MEELYLRLQQKEEIIKELLSTKSLQAVEQVAALQELLQTVFAREQQHHVSGQNATVQCHLCALNSCSCG